MAKICNIGILSVVRKTIGGKGYFLMNEENNDFIKVNQQVFPFKNNDTKSYAMSIDLAKRLNTSINSERKIGTVFYAKQYSDVIGVDINPSDGQLAILNAEEEADMVEGLAMIADEKKEEENVIPPIVRLSDNELSNNALAEQNSNEENDLPFQKVQSSKDKIIEDLRTKEKLEMATTNDSEKRKEIYDTYDKLITPLLKADTIKEGVENIFKQSPELANIGTPQQYSQYLDSIFPDSKVKNIKWHGGYISKENKFDKKYMGSGKADNGFYFASMDSAINYMSTMGDAPNLIASILNIKNPYTLQRNKKEDIKLENYGRKELRTEAKNNDSIIYNDNYLKESLKDPNAPNDIQSDFNDEFIVFESEQIHILGNAQDIEGFNNWVREDVYKSDDRDDQGDGSEQDELGYIDEQNDDTKDFIDQKDVSLLSEQDIQINNKIDELLNNGDIIQYCQ